jgi:hypothetical protein
MRKFMILIIAAILVVGMLLTACDELENVTEPENAKWSVFVTSMDQGKEDTHAVMVMWIGPAADYVAPTSVELKIDGTAATLEEWYGYWFGGLTLNPGQRYEFELIIDGVTVVKTRQYVVYDADVVFPMTFNPTLTAHTYWTLEGNSDSQMASAYALDPEDPLDDETVDQELLPADREYTFPANIVQDHGVGTIFTLEITQMNYKYVDDVLVATAQAAYQDYGDAKRDRSTREELVKFAKRAIGRVL